MTTPFRLRVAFGLAAMCAAILLASAQVPQTPPPATGTGQIAGRVLTADTGKPIRGATVRIVSFEVMRVAKTAVTDADGHFQFTALVAGNYQLQASAERYVGLQYGQRYPTEPGKPLAVGEGASIENADVLLPRTSAISGTLLDEFGDPVPNVVVQVSRRTYAAGQHRLLPVSQAHPTDDKGQFRAFDLPAGDYYLTALAGAFADPASAGGFAPTYYPGGANLASAKAVHVGYGDDAAGLVLPLVPAATFEVGGHVTDATGMVAAATVFITPADSPAFLMARTGSDPTGSFVFRGVPPGTYTVQAYGRSPNGALGQSPFGWASVTVGDRDVPNLQLVVGSAKASGRILFEGTPAAPPRAGGVLLTGAPVRFDSAPIVGGGPPMETIHDDWSFEMDNMSGLRVLRFGALPPPWILSRITLNGADVTDVPIDFSHGDVAGLEVTLTNRVTAVSGMVTGADGKPATNYAVVILASDAAKWSFPSRFIVVARPNQTGAYSASGLPPESYLAVALASVDGTDYQDPELLERLRPLATAFSLTDGAHAALNLVIVARPQ